jgi:hypothetical protein
MMIRTRSSELAHFAVLIVVATSAASFLAATAFTPLQQRLSVRRACSTARFGYLDDLSKDLYGPDSNPDIDAESREATRMDRTMLDRAGPGSWQGFVDFDEFVSRTSNSVRLLDHSHYLLNFDNRTAGTDKWAWLVMERRAWRKNGRAPLKWPNPKP